MDEVAAFGQLVNRHDTVGLTGLFDLDSFDSQRGSAVSLPPSLIRGEGEATYPVVDDLGPLFGSFPVDPRRGGGFCLEWFRVIFGGTGRDESIDDEAEGREVELACHPGERGTFQASANCIVQLHEARSVCAHA